MRAAQELRLEALHPEADAAATRGGGEADRLVVSHVKIFEVPARVIAIDAAPPHVHTDVIEKGRRPRHQAARGVAHIEDRKGIAEQLALSLERAHDSLLFQRVAEAGLARNQDGRKLEQQSGQLDLACKRNAGAEARLLEGAQLAADAAASLSR